MSEQVDRDQAHVEQHGDGDVNIENPTPPADGGGDADDADDADSGDDN